MVRMVQEEGRGTGRFARLTADLTDKANTGAAMAVVITDPTMRARIKATMSEYPNVTVISGEQPVPDGAEVVRVYT